MDITTLSQGEDITDTKWTGKEKAVQEDLISGVGQEAFYQIIIRIDFSYWFQNHLRRSPIKNNGTRCWKKPLEIKKAIELIK